MVVLDARSRAVSAGSGVGMVGCFVPFLGPSVNLTSQIRRLRLPCRVFRAFKARSTRFIYHLVPIGTWRYLGGATCSVAFSRDAVVRPVYHARSHSEKCGIMRGMFAAEFLSRLSGAQAPPF
jgi:hypothetical protein